MIHEALIDIQSRLKANKGQTNSFGGYKYRSCEDILEAVKPLLKENGVTLTMSDEMVLVGERVYVKATAALYNAVNAGIASVTVSAFAREPLVRKGMDESQITGAASSYARKYALNGLFCIDDTKDADTRDNSTIDVKPVDEARVNKATSFFVDEINADEDENSVAPRIQAAYNRLTPDEQIAVNSNLKTFKFGNRQMNTILKGFLDYRVIE